MTEMVLRLAEADAEISGSFPIIAQLWRPLARALRFSRDLPSE